MDRASCFRCTVDRQAVRGTSIKKACRSCPLLRDRREAGADMRKTPSEAVNLQDDRFGHFAMIKTVTFGMP